MIVMRFGDLLEFRKDIFFDGAVQIDWFYNRDKATLVNIMEQEEVGKAISRILLVLFKR